jgi:hypothetical protein
MIPVAYPWTTNADLLTDAAFPILRTAGLWRDDMSLLDPTYGDGKWWKRYTPINMVTHTRRDEPEWDFRSMPYQDGTFDAVVFDPPYCGKGGRATSGIKEMDDAYGLTDSPRSPAGLLAQNISGLHECLRVGSRVVMLKSMDFVAGGELHCHTRALEEAAAYAGWSIYERFVHLPNGGRPQPPGRRELRARLRPSTLTIFVPHRLRRGCP